jgi:hypothetical protein
MASGVRVRTKTIEMAVHHQVQYVTPSKRGGAARINLESGDRPPRTILDKRVQLAFSAVRSTVDGLDPLFEMFKA